MKSAKKTSNQSYIPSREEITKAASDLIPKLRERAQETEDLRTMPDETLQDMKDAGIHKMFTPKR